MLHKIQKWNEEIISPQEYLNLTEEQKKKILKATPYVKPLGSVSLDDDNFAGIRITWKMPVYKFKL